MNYLNGFISKDRKKALKKIESFFGFGKEKVHIVLDFDRTLTKSRNGLGEDVSAWEILKSRLPKKAQKEYQKLYDKYRPLEVQNKMKKSDAAIWPQKILNIYKKSKLKLFDTDDKLEKRMPIRPCAKELFEICKKKNIPTIIISAGIKNVIQMWCKKFGIEPTVIISVNLFFDDKGHINGWDKASLIHAFNKREKGHREISSMRKSRPNIILIGDSIDDASMVAGDKNVLRIILDDSMANNIRHDGRFYKDMSEKFDLIIRNKSLCPVAKIVNLF